MALEELCNLSFNDKYSENEFENFNELCHNFSSNLELAVPPYPDPATNLSRFLKDESGKAINIKFDHGTTTLGFQYRGGVVLAVDSRATGGSFIGSQTMKKIVEINDFLLGIRHLGSTPNPVLSLKIIENIL